MDESFITRLKQACGLSDGDGFLSDDTDDEDETYDPECDPNVTALLFASDSSDVEDIVSDDSAVVDLRKVDSLGLNCLKAARASDPQMNTDRNGSGRKRVHSDSAQVPSTSGTQPSADVEVTGRRPRRKTYDRAMRLIAVMNADNSDSEDETTETGRNEWPAEGNEESSSGDSSSRVKQKSSPSVSTRVRSRNGAGATNPGRSDTEGGEESSEESSHESSDENPSNKRKQTLVSAGHGNAVGVGISRRGRGGGRSGRRHSRGGTVVSGADGGGRNIDKVEERAQFYEQRPMIGSRRFQGGPEGGSTQNGIFYGPGTLTEDDFLQPRDRTYPSIKVMPNGYSWRGRPKRQPMCFDFKPKRHPGVHHVQPEWTCTEVFEALWEDCEVVWRNATNAKGREICAKTGETFREVTEVDTRAFLACKLWIDLFRKPELRMYWCGVLDFCSPFMKRARDSTGMSHRRFQQIKLWSRLYDKDLASETGMNNPRSLNYDVSHKAREYLDTMNRSCEKFMEPDEIISFDESMLEYTGIGGEKQTIRSKPIPTGLMFYAACTRSGYFLRTLLHAKQTLPYWQEMGVPFSTVWSMMSGAIGSGMANYLDTGRTLITDRAYTSVSLAYALAFRSTYFIGTTKRNLKCVPDCVVKESADGGTVKNVNKSSKHSMSRGDAYFLHDNAGVVSFCVWQDNKAVPVLYTTRTVEEMTVCKRLVKGGRKEGNEFSRPLILNEYDAGMGGVDIGDQHIAAQHRPTRCFVWYTPILFRSFDVFCNNVFCIKQSYGHQMTMLSVKLNIAYGMLQKAQEMAGSVRGAIARELPIADRIHNPYSVKSADRQPCVSCRRRTTTGCEDCELPCHLNQCWKQCHENK